MCSWDQFWGWGSVVAAPYSLLYARKRIYSGGYRNLTSLRKERV